MCRDFMLDERPITGYLRDLLPIKVIIVDKTEFEPVWDFMVRNYHYLGYDNMIGPRIKYLVFHEDTPIAALSYNRASLKIGVRDTFLGWQEKHKKSMLQYVVNNNRFLILPWVKVKNLASHLLSRTLKMLKQDWFDKFGVEPYVVETFVDKDKYRGTCYQAANWLYLGETKGFSKIGKVFVYYGNKKGVFIYLLKKDIKAIISRLPRIPRNLPHRYPPRKAPERKRVPNMLLSIPDWDSNILEQAGITEGGVEKLGAMLEEYLAAFDKCYHHANQRKHGEAFVKGLLSNLDRKSIEPIALEYMGEKGVRAMQIFFKDSPWDDSKMLEKYQQRLSAAAGDPDAMLNVDGCDFPKKGRDSIGVFRQYCGILGKTENCQSGVFVGYSSSKGYGLVDRRLYIPKAWFGENYADARKECELPPEVVFKTKNELASEMIHSALASERFPAKWIGCDSAFGVDREFLDSLPEHCYYFADVRSNELVFESMPAMVVAGPSYTGRRHKHAKPSFPPVRVDSYVSNEKIPWQKVILAEGAKGPIVADVKCVRCVVCASTTVYGNYVAPGESVWLYIRRYADGKTKYSLCNAPEDTPIDTLHKVATMRWPIEQCFEECKSHLGMGHYETRSWKAWHRHMLFVFLAHLFITEVRMAFKKNAYSDNATG